MDSTLFQIRATAVPIENDRILLVKQRVNNARNWSLPGGKVEAPETIENAIVREVYEETGLTVCISKLLYVCDNPGSNPPGIHITFSVERRGGQITLPTNDLDRNPIQDVQFVPIDRINQYGFSHVFMEKAINGFIDSGNYRGPKANIGL